MATRRTAPRARAAVVPLPRRARAARLELARLAPSRRSVLLGLALLAAAGGAYAVARETSLFAVRAIEVRGASPSVAAQVRSALAPLAGASLLVVNAAAVERRLGALATVESSSVDRAFPNTLRVFVRPERPLAVVRRGADAWLLSRRGRVVRTLDRHARAGLPRIWVARRTALRIGARLAGDPALAARALGPVAGTPFLGRIRLVRATTGGLTLVLRSGLEIRLGDQSDLRLKLAVARHVLRALGPGPGYLDVSVPERPVARPDSQVEG